MPLSTLQETPHDVPCKTRGQDGFDTSFPVGLLRPYNMPVYPGALRVARHPPTIGQSAALPPAASGAFTLRGISRIGVIH
jgi:hypothetical protein